eukprot:Colp12_sorted_trinity150504_noHs@2027
MGACSGKQARSEVADRAPPNTSISQKLLEDAEKNRAVANVVTGRFDPIPQNTRLVFTIALSELREGVTFVDNCKYIIDKKGEVYTVAKNKCQHRGGEFADVVDMEDIHLLTCVVHGWKLDASKMEYIKPSKRPHPKLDCSVQGTVLNIYKKVKDQE